MATMATMATMPVVAFLVLLVLTFGSFAAATTFTLINTCAYTVWPGISADAGQPLLAQGGLALSPGQSAQLPAPPGWSGRFWGRTGCAFDGATGRGSCETGDCGGVLECAGAGGSPPITLAEFTLGQKDFYDVSLVDGYNVGVSVSADGGDRTTTTTMSGGSGSVDTTPPCANAGCGGGPAGAGAGNDDRLLMGGLCPADLIQTDSGGRVVACRSACEAFAQPQYCCTGAFSTPQTCGPSSYSRLFKSACPSAYSYAYDDPSSTFTCSGASGYTITFCPTS